MRIHLVAIGGSVMHNLAINLSSSGHDVSGSDDEIYEPSRSRLQARQLLPAHLGWDADRITSDIDVVILGKHARSDNPELLAAQRLGLPIFSFPEFVDKNSSAVHKVAVTGSHGKTSTTAMILHALKSAGREPDYLVGAQLKGFDTMVRLSGADLLVVEGDEYPSSCIDDRPKMLHYGANISIITGVAWDHVNIYKTYEDYLGIFRSYLLQSQEGDVVFFDKTDKTLTDLVLSTECQCKRIGYEALEVDGKNNAIWEGKAYPLRVFGNHNFKNLSAARAVCELLGITSEGFLRSIADFTGAAKRLELLSENDQQIVYRDFAHAPSKVQATAAAIRSRYKHRSIGALLELHTFSSLNIEFIQHYAGSLDPLDEVAVFYDPAALKLKKMPMLSKKAVAEAFGHVKLVVLDSPEAVSSYLKKLNTEVILIMSSGNLGGVEPMELLG